MGARSQSVKSLAPQKLPGWSDHTRRSRRGTARCLRSPECCSHQPWAAQGDTSRADTKCPSSHSRCISKLKFAFALSHNILGACYAARDNQSSQHTNTGGPQSVLKEGSTPEHPEAKLLITGPRLSPECPVISLGP